MARTNRLKVFKTSIGLHDAYVAVPSQKAALEAWGASSELFGIGSAEVVTDPTLTVEPLSNPGKVIKRPRASVDEQLAAAGELQSMRRRPLKEAPKESPLPPDRRPKPRPSRRVLDETEAALSVIRILADREMSEFNKKKKR